MITLTIDGQEIQVKEGRTILEAARQHGPVAIPTLCYHEALAPFAACRMCLVELENRRGGQLVPACAYPCEEGLIVRTNSEKVRRSRRMTIELLMASAAHVPLIRAMAEDLGVDEPRATPLSRTTASCAACACGPATRSSACTPSAWSTAASRNGSAHPSALPPMSASSAAPASWSARPAPSPWRTSPGPRRPCGACSGSRSRRRWTAGSAATTYQERQFADIAVVLAQEAVP